MNWKWIKGFNIRPEPIKLQEENVQKKRLAIYLAMIFFFLIWPQKQRQQKQKIANKWDHIKL